MVVMDSLPERSIGRPTTAKPGPGPCAPRYGAAVCAALLMGLFVSACVGQSRSIVVKLPDSVWTRNPGSAGPGRAGISTGHIAAYRGGPARFDTQLLAHLGGEISDSAAPAGCPQGWAVLDYGRRFSALGCDAYLIADDFPSRQDPIRTELALDGKRVLGVIASDFSVSQIDADARADYLIGYYAHDCGCTAFSAHGSDCDCGGYMVRVMSMRDVSTQHPVVTLFYYSDGDAFTQYWHTAAAMTKSGPARQPQAQ